MPLIRSFPTLLLVLFVLFVVVVLLSSSAARAEPAEGKSAVATRTLDLRAGPGLVGLAGGVGQGGLVAGVSAPFWCSERVGPLRFELSVLGAGGITADGSWQIVAGPTAGAEIFLVEWLSLEMWAGLGAGGQVATHGPAAFTAGMQGGGGWAVRPFSDRQHRFSLGFLMASQLAFTDAPGNDCPLCHGLQAVTLAWRMPY